VVVSLVKHSLMDYVLHKLHALKLANITLAIMFVLTALKIAQRAKLLQVNVHNVLQLLLLLCRRGRAHVHHRRLLLVENVLLLIRVLQDNTTPVTMCALHAHLSVFHASLIRESALNAI